MRGKAACQEDLSAPGPVSFDARFPSSIYSSLLGSYSYIQAGEIIHLKEDPRTVWERSPGFFNFLYRYPPSERRLDIHFSAGKPPRGILMDFVEDCTRAFQQVFSVVDFESAGTMQWRW